MSSAKWRQFCLALNVLKNNIWALQWHMPVRFRSSCGFRVNTLRPRQNGRHFPDDRFKCIFLNENAWMSIEISLKFVPKGPINNSPALVQIMAWRRPGDKPLSVPMMVNLLTHICVTRPQCVNDMIDQRNRSQFPKIGRKLRKRPGNMIALVSINANTYLFPSMQKRLNIILKCKIHNGVGMVK